MARLSAGCRSGLSNSGHEKGVLPRWHDGQHTWAFQKSRAMSSAPRENIHLSENRKMC